jgi:hypothetical protein
VLLQKYAPQWKKGVVLSVSGSSGLSWNFGIHVNCRLIYVKKSSRERVNSTDFILQDSPSKGYRSLDCTDQWWISKSGLYRPVTGIGWAELSRKRQNLNRSNSEVYLQPKSANLRRSKTVTPCLRCDEAKLRMEKLHLSHKCEFNRPKCYADTKTLNP